MQRILLYTTILLLTNATLTEAQICVGQAGQLQWQCWQNLYDDEFGELRAEDDYPAHPDVSQTIFKVQGPLNYDNFMGGRIAGFISVPLSGNVQFNITGDDQVQFYLSSDTTEANLSLEAFTEDWTAIEDHTKYPTQTTGNIYLTSGNHYYFELSYVEATGGDHVSLYWKTSFLDPLNWNLVSAEYINDVDCLPASCPLKGTPCDDGNILTANDIEDGYCNCFGEATSQNSCVGEWSKITNYRYTGIPGSNLNDLYLDPNFPALPATSYKLDRLATPKVSRQDSIGNLIQGFLKVPVTGNYKFNVTGDNETIFFLSSDDTEANKQNTQILVTGNTSPTQHDRYIYQSSGWISLDASKFYYIELNHKEGGGSEHFSVFWQTPFTQLNTWKRIPDIYFYEYECGLACIAPGTLCDDGDPFTNNDQYDNNCDCVGIPCTPATCTDPLASYIPYPKCQSTDQLDNRADNNWLSCTQSSNPNSLRGVSHWIQYDLGNTHALFDSHVWNYNEQGATNQGFQMVAVDISMDGTNWTQFNTYNWSLASGDSGYSGFVGPNFGGVLARYILITCLDAGPACKGLGKTSFRAISCPPSGSSCDDGDPNTIGDKYDSSCNCLGVPYNENQCVIDTLLLGDTLLYSDNYSAIKYVESKNLLDSLTTFSLIAGETISLDTGFVAPANSDLYLLIDTCTGSKTLEYLPRRLTLEEKMAEEEAILKIISNGDNHTIQFKLEAGQEIKLDIFDTQGKLVHRIIEHHYRDKGIFLKRFRSKKLDRGSYIISLDGEKTQAKERLIVNQ